MYCVNVLISYIIVLAVNICDLRVNIERKNMQTLTEFIYDELNKYHLAFNKKNSKKLRAFFTKRLKAKKQWENAKEKVIGRNRTKFFELSVLQALDQEKSTISYLTNLAIKEAGFKKEELTHLAKVHAEKAEQEEENFTTFALSHSQKEVEEYLQNQPQQLTLTVQQEALRNLKIDAIFNLFFSMDQEQKDLFLSDYQTNFIPAKETYNNPLWALSQERLKAPSKYYYTKKAIK